MPPKENRAMLIMGESNYKKLASGKKCKEKINVVRPGKGANAYALVEVASIPSRFLQLVNQKYPNQGIKYDTTQMV